MSPVENSRALGRVRFEYTLMADLQRATIFLSASFPSGTRGERFRPYDASGIADAVSAFGRAILGSNGRLVFGGHPTITPVVLMIARELRVKDSVFVFQSAWFRDQSLPEINEIEREQLGSVEWIRQADERGDSLRIMREEMLGSRRYDGALFIGGMEGISDEYNLLKRHSPNTPCIPVAGPGGAAAALPSTDWEILGLSTLRRSRAYPFLALRLVSALAGEHRLSGRM